MVFVDMGRIMLKYVNIYQFFRYEKRAYDFYYYKCYGMISMSEKGGRKDEIV